MTRSRAQAGQWMQAHGHNRHKPRTVPYTTEASTHGFGWYVGATLTVM
ncbi:MAG: hypothetical protein ACXABD_21535 [Candidatus Thorarchaeota archaeon]